MRRVGSALWPKLRVLQIYGANTDVGKTIFSTILCTAFARRLQKVYYLKPVSTGPLEDADDRHVSSYVSNVQTRCLYQFSDPVSPHIAARSSRPVSDNAVQIAVYDELQRYSNSSSAGGIALLETAGGVLSPSPSSSSQADLYRPFRIPVLLLGDHKLGGIGTTISSWESLHIRGYDVQSVALFNEEKYQNYSYLKDYFAERNVNTFCIDPPPEPKASKDADRQSLQAYYRETSQTSGVARFTEKLLQDHERRIDELKRMPEEADKAIWHPFLQHRERSKDTIVAMDSAYGDYFETYTTARELSQSSSEISAPSLLKPAFDGSASWWTQGLGHGNPRLALTAAHAAGRYGHVMFAGAVHEPALRLAKCLIEKMGNPRLSKVFYTDNGSTGMEVAVKMALRAATVRNNWTPEDEVLILGLTNSYHGDTIGTMDCSEPSIFNKKVEWYKGRGYWFDFPQVQMRKGKWFVQTPDPLKAQLGASREFAELQNIFDLESRFEDRKLYKNYFDSELSRLRSGGKKLGGLILEPVVLGAGGMMLADPLFQRCLVEAVRDTGSGGGKTEHDWSGMPVIFDEVFTGLYRLGKFSAADFLGVDPDIVVNAKLLTGGLLPLCTTTASQSIFDAFLSNDKSDALLHGHSYTAHAVGCAVANESLTTMMKLDRDGSWDDFRSNWNTKNEDSGQVTGNREPWSMWSHEFVHSLSHKAKVDHVWALGSVLAISMADPSGSGYASTAATALRDHLLAGGVDDEWVVHSRVLGNVLYLMAAMATSVESLQGLQEKVLAHVE